MASSNPVDSTAAIDFGDKFWLFAYTLRNHMGLAETKHGVSRSHYLAPKGMVPFLGWRNAK